MKKNIITKQTSTKIETATKEKMKVIVNRIVELIRIKHLG
jgi:hypothetical protein